MDACQYDSSEMPPSLTSKQRFEFQPRLGTTSYCTYCTHSSSIERGLTEDLNNARAVNYLAR
eukprot:scaffold6379_cov250-Skeletonema_marinoi.AAC.2